MDATPNASPVPVMIDEASNPKGTEFASWMRGVMVTEVKAPNLGDTVVSLDMTKGERWLYGPSATKPPVNFQFTTPNENVPEQRCGKVAFSDMHVSADSSSFGAFPNGCAGSALTAQEKALAFMFFDLASCLGDVY
jgi:hypothetical protein